MRGSGAIPPREPWPVPWSLSAERCARRRVALDRPCGPVRPAGSSPSSDRPGSMSSLWLTWCAFVLSIRSCPRRSFLLSIFYQLTLLSLLRRLSPTFQSSTNGRPAASPLVPGEGKVPSVARIEGFQRRFSVFLAPHLFVNYLPIWQERERDSHQCHHLQG